jgi:hypothetical protein
MYSLENINDWVSDLATKSNITKFRTYAMVLREQERMQAESAILSRPRWKNNGRCCYSAQIIFEDMAIITEMQGGAVVGYYASVGDYDSCYRFMEFDEALLCALSIKYTGDENATGYMAKLLK